MTVLTETDLARHDAKLEQILAASDARWERRIGNLRAELLKWMFIFWVGPTFAVIAAVALIVRR